MCPTPRKNRWGAPDSHGRAHPMLPTPTLTGNNNRKGLSEKSGDGLATVVRGLMPTPAAQTQEGGLRIEGGARGRKRMNLMLATPTKGEPTRGGSYGNGSPTLSGQMHALLPTPVKRDAKLETWSPAHEARRAADPRHTPRLNVVVSRLAPTPTKADAEGSLGQVRGDGRAKNHLSSLMVSQNSNSPPAGLGSEVVISLVSITEWLMGFEPGWLLLAWPLGSRLARRLRPGRTTRGPASAPTATPSSPT